MTGVPPRLSGGEKMERELPDGWIRASESDREATQRELATELLPTDLLAGIVLRVIAAWDSDDSVLVEHLDSELLSVVHLSYGFRMISYTL